MLKNNSAATGIAWEGFPEEMGCCGMTLWNRLNAWRQAGLWKRLHEVLLARLNEADQIDWFRATIDSASVRAVRGGKNGSQPRRSPKTRLGSTMC